MVIKELTINPMLKDSFSIERLEDFLFEKDIPCRYEGHQILFIAKGSASLTIDGQQLTPEAGSLLLLSKGQVYAFHKGALSGYLLQFGDCFWEKTPASASNCKAALFETPGVQRLFQPSSADWPLIENLFATTLQEFEAPGFSNKADVLAAYLKIIIIKIANIHSLLQKELATYDGGLYQDFLTLIRKDYSKAHEVSFFAQKLGVSSRKLTDICKQHGAGAKELIIEQLLSEAKRSLQFSTRPIKEVAGDLGFSSPVFSISYPSRPA